MKQILEALQNDHRNYKKLLSILKKDIEMLQTSDDPDFIRLYDVMNYMTHYPDFRHHPVEEIIFNDLLNITSDPAELVDSLVEEHKELADLGATLKEKLKHIVSGSIVSKDAIIESATNYHQCLTDHINREEGMLFPIIENTFSDDDWRQIDIELDEIEDPLFGEVVLEQYSDLYKRISLSGD